MLLGYSKYILKSKLFKYNVSYSKYFYANELDNIYSNTVNLGFNAISSLGSTPFTSFSSNSFSTTSNWKEYCFTVSHDSTVIGNVRLLKIQFLDAGTYYLDHVTVNSSDYICSSTTTTSINDSELSQLKIRLNGQNTTYQRNSELVDENFISPNALDEIVNQKMKQKS